MNTASINRHLARGLCLVAIAATFGLWSLRYPIGEFGRAGPGLFPLIVSAALGLIGIVTTIRARFVAAEPMQFNVRNLGLVLGGLLGFAFISAHSNMIAGIVFMVFCATAAGTSYSVVRNLKICTGLIAIAFAMSKLLGVNLPLI